LTGNRDREKLTMIGACTKAKATVKGVCWNIISTDLDVYRQDTSTTTLGKKLGQCGCRHPAASMLIANK
jgi:hypothetical protein